MRLTQTCRRQQEQLSQLRNIAWELMDTTYQNGDGEQDIIRQQEKVRGRIKKFRRRFAERLWLQPIVIAEWCPNQKRPPLCIIREMEKSSLRQVVHVSQLLFSAGSARPVPRVVRVGVFKFEVSST